MKGWLAIPLLVTMFQALPDDAFAGAYCGAAHYRHCKASCCPAPACCVKKMCQQTVYEERKFTTYETKYEDIVEMKEIDAIKYVPETEMRDVTVTCWETPAKPPCAPAACAPADCGGSCSCCPKVPVQCVRQVPWTVYRCTHVKEKVPVTRCVERITSKTFTCKVPRVVCVECPVPVCAPIPSCGCGGAGAPGQTY